MDTPTLPESARIVHPEAPPAAVPIRKPDDLDVPLLRWLGGGVLLTAALVAALSPFRSGYLGTLLLDRGLTQFGSLYLASATLVFLILKAVKVFRGHAHLRNVVRLPPLLYDATPGQAVSVRDAWIRSGSAPALRRARVLQAYIATGARASAAEKTEEDAVLAQNALDQAYSLPRALIWAIPLMGFIGTVVGISAAVAGFSGFLAQAEEIDQIKSGIGAVTTGLAVAFDTTLVALALSVVVMLPLVLLERLEGRLLLAVESDVSDAVMGRLPEGGVPASLDRTVVTEVVREALAERLPDPEAMVRAAEVYLRAGADAVARGAKEAAGHVAEAGMALRVQHEQLVARLDAATTEMHERMAARDEASGRALTGLAASVEQSGRDTLQELRGYAQKVASGLAQHAGTIAQSLERVGATFQQRADALERHSAQLSEVMELEHSLQRTLRTLQDTNELRRALEGVELSLRSLQPGIERLSQPRRIMLVEGEGER